VALQKVDYYSSMNTAFLRELAEGINLSFRFHGDKNKDALLRILQRKLDAEKMGIVFKLYLTCFEAKDIVQVIKPKGMSEIVEKLESFFSASEYLHEVTVGLRRCDLVFFSADHINAIEVKSALDKPKRALDQLEYYKKWANKVYLAYDVQHNKTVKRLTLKENGVGLIQFSNGRIQLINEATFQEQNKVSLFSLMTYNYLRKIARNFGISLKGGKQAISKRLDNVVTESEVKAFFRDFLRTRALI